MTEDNGGLLTYVVQVMVKENGIASEWQDVATVKVPPRTRRKTIIEKAHGQVALTKADTGGKVVRVLDEESAYQFPVAVVAGPEQLVIG